jgi:hypothetical protein
MFSHLTTSPRWRCVALAAGLLVATAVGADRPTLRTDATGSDEPFHAQLREIAKTYRGYGHVDYREAAWAPSLCRAPIPYHDYHPGTTRLSGSKDTDTHGQKLYFLFAKQKDAYLRLTGKTNPVGQVVVKESWTPKETTEEEYKRYLADHARVGREGGMPFARKDGKVYRTDQQSALFIMFKTNPSTPGTDQGWVYGTVTADGKTVTAAGRVESCMGCHQDAKHDRLFGLKGGLPRLPSEERAGPGQVTGR